VGPQEASRGRPEGAGGRAGYRPDNLPAALANRAADWVYVRFVAAAEQVGKVHVAGKRVFMLGPLVAGIEPYNWCRARDAGVDALLTDPP